MFPRPRARVARRTFGFVFLLFIHYELLQSVHTTSKLDRKRVYVILFFHLDSRHEENTFIPEHKLRKDPDDKPLTIRLPTDFCVNDKRF